MRNEYKIDGDKVLIFLRRRDNTILETLIDLDDFDKVNSFPYTWFAYLDKKSPDGSFYVRGNMMREDGTQYTVHLHRWIISPEDGWVVDHRNHDTLNNTRENLRVATHSENMRNKKGAHRQNKSGIRNVTWSKNVKKWEVIVTKDKIQHRLGYYDDIEEAARVAEEARKRLH